MYCRKCHYDLRGHAQARKCPECGEYFDPLDPLTFHSSLPRKRSPVEWVAVIVAFVVVGSVIAYGIQYMAAVGGGH